MIQVASGVRRDLSGDRLVKGVLDDGAFRFVAGRLTDSVRRACTVHGLSGPRARLLSDALVSTAILASPIKRQEKYSLSVHGKGLMKSLNADIDFHGNMRGYIRTAPEIDWPADVTMADFLAPPGVMQITRSLPDRILYQGITEFRLGDIGADIALHVSTSDQVETEVRTMVMAGREGPIAGGLAIQALPGTSLDLFIPMRAKLDAFEREGWPPALIEAPERFVEEILGDFNPYILEISPVQYRCNCSRERVESIFQQMNAEDIASLLEPDGSAVASCHWCNAEYYFAPEEMRKYAVPVVTSGRSEEAPN